MDFERSAFAFIESTGFLVTVLALAVASYAAARLRGRGDGGDAEGERGRSEASDRDPVVLATGAMAVVLGAVLFGGSLSAGGLLAWPGLVGGAALALAAYAAASGLLLRVRRRLDAGAGALLPVWADAAAVALALTAILFPPAALVGLLGLAYLLLAARRERDRRYEGLRVLR